MIQTKSGALLPTLSPRQLDEIRRAADAPLLPVECRVHPDDWDELRRTLPHGTLPATPGSASLCADMSIGSPSGHFTEIRVVLDVDAPRLPLKGGSSSPSSIWSSS